MTQYLKKSEGENASTIMRETDKVIRKPQVIAAKGSSTRY